MTDLAPDMQPGRRTAQRRNMAKKEKFEKLGTGKRFMKKILSQKVDDFSRGVEDVQRPG
ncbi:MAG: hypothetical protein LBO05_00300 [Deltaproteobacteria bacterium]|nr:hypothetical protein [Deltaproteobacteria bacterium]